MKTLCNLYAIFNLALFSQHECLILVKRKREKIEEEFRKEVEKTAECIMYSRFIFFGYHKFDVRWYINL